MLPKTVVEIQQIFLLVALLLSWSWLFAYATMSEERDD